jgi:hypothetical protein
MTTLVEVTGDKVIDIWQNINENLNHMEEVYQKIMLEEDNFFWLKGHIVWSAILGTNKSFQI